LLSTSGRSTDLGLFSFRLTSRSRQHSTAQHFFFFVVDRQAAKSLLLPRLRSLGHIRNRVTRERLKRSAGIGRTRRRPTKQN
jgi:hypothetical protein